MFCVNYIDRRIMLNSLKESKCLFFQREVSYLGHVQFSWDSKCENAFQRLKTLLVSAPILAQPQVYKPYKLYTDASNYAVGGVLMQDFPEGPRIIQYVSKQLSDGQKKWPTIEREAYAIIFAVNKLRPYLRGSKFPPQGAQSHVNYRPRQQGFENAHRRPENDFRPKYE